MSPRLVLTLWRERWKKEASTTSRAPYLQGKLNEWGDQLTRNNIWSVPGMVWIASLCCLAIFFLTIWVVLNTATQILFSTCLVGAALYLRRYRGMLVTLILIGMSLIASTRYLSWRFNSIFSQDYSLASILALGLCLAELYLWTVTALNFLTTIWPLKRVSVQLPVETTDWPTVDVFITISSRSLKEIKHITTAALALEWPKSKLKIHLLDNLPQAGTKEFARSTGVNYLVYPDALHDDVGIINWATSQTEGSLIALFQCDEPPSPKFLTKTVGWFIEDLKLGIIQTPRHFLASDVSENYLNIFSNENSGISCVLIRRSALFNFGKINQNSVAQELGTPIKLQEQSYRHSFIGFTSKKNGSFNLIDNVQKSKPNPSVELFLVDNPFSKTELNWRKKLNTLQEFLNFYFFVPQFIFFTAPLAYIFSGIDIIQVTPTLLLAYFLPHLLHAYLATGRLEEKSRFTAWGDLKEATLAWYLLLPTAVSLLRTELGRFKETLSPRKKEKDETFDWIIAWPYGIIFSLNLIGFLAGIRHELSFGGFQNSIALMCLVWVFYNLLLLMGTLAVAKEFRHIKKHTQQQLRHAAMIQLPSGRTITGITENFPDLTLEVSLPIKPGVEIGTIISLSIFHGQEELTFHAKVAINDDQIFRITILEKSQSSYQALGALALSRDEYCSSWLPGRNADRPLPKWLSRPFIAALGKAYAIAEKLGLPTKVNLLVSWIKYWEKTT